MAHQGGTAIGTMPEEVGLIASKQERKKLSTEISTSNANPLPRSCLGHTYCSTMEGGAVSTLIHHQAQLWELSS